VEAGVIEIRRPALGQGSLIGDRVALIDEHNSRKITARYPDREPTKVPNDVPVSRIDSLAEQTGLIDDAGDTRDLLVTNYHNRRPTEEAVRRGGRIVNVAGPSLFKTERHISRPHPRTMNYVSVHG
jgi:hypothetical protein